MGFFALSAIKSPRHQANWNDSWYAIFVASWFKLSSGWNTGSSLWVEVALNRAFGVQAFGLEVTNFIFIVSWFEPLGARQPFLSLRASEPSGFYLLVRAFRLIGSYVVPSGSKMKFELSGLHGHTLCVWDCRLVQAVGINMTCFKPSSFICLGSRHQVLSHVLRAFRLCIPLFKPLGYLFICSSLRAS